MLAIMSQLPPVNQTCWDSGRSQMPTLSVSDVQNFDEEKLDEILPSDLMSVNSAFKMDAEVNSEAQAESYRSIIFPLTHDSVSKDSNVPITVEEPSTIYQSMNDVIENQMNSLLMNSLSFPHDENIGNFSLDRTNTIFERSFSLQDGDILDQSSCTISHRNNAVSENLGDSSDPPLSTVDLQGQEMDQLTDLDTVSTFQSVSSSLATDTKNQKLSSSDVDGSGESSSYVADGRWTPDEHEAFLQGLQRHGREWKKVAQSIPTRTSSQIRSHAQKYFAKIAREEQQRALSLNRALDPADGSAQNIPLSVLSSSQMSVPYSQTTLTPSAQVWLERILVDPEAVQREVEDQLGRLRARYRELQIAMEQRQSNENGSLRHPQNESVHRRDSSSSSESSYPNTFTNLSGRRRHSDPSEIIPDLPSTSQEDIGTSSGNRSITFPQDELLHNARIENPSSFQHHLRNSMAALCRKRLFSERIVPLSTSLTRTLDSPMPMDIRNGSTCIFSSPATSSVDGRALGNEELIALEVLGGDLRRNISAENLTFSATHDSFDATEENNVKFSIHVMVSSSAVKQEDNDSDDSRNSKRSRCNKEDDSSK